MVEDISLGEQEWKSGERTGLATIGPRLKSLVEKETRVKFNPGLSANRPSNNGGNPAMD